jgi:glycosyltransferase involved in cell wall biosynthesis
VEHADLPALLKISDIFVRPSIIEGMGNAFIEAFAAGIPVVATPVGGIPDFLFDSERTPDVEPTGVFCNVRDPESMARAVRRYLDDPALVASVVKNASALVEDTYDWDAIAENMRTKLFAPLTGK